MAQKKFIIDGGFQTNADSVITGNLEMTGSIVPSVNSDGTTGFDLGSADYKWRDLYLSQGSLYIDGQKVLQSDSGTIVVSADVDQSLTTKTTGAGVLTFQSPNPISIQSTLQMATGKRITSADGVAVVLGDKLDMDSNQIINVGAPTGAAHVATKGYVDQEISNLIGGAPGVLDTLNEIANALGDDANFAATITTALATKASIEYVNSAEVALQSYADTAEADAVATAAAYTDAEITSTVSYVDSEIVIAKADAATAATTYTDAEVVTLQASIDSEASARSAADTALAADIASEETARVAADTGLDTAKADKTVTLTAGDGLTGGGDLSANRTFNVGAGTGIVVAADTVSVDTTWADARYVNPADLVHFHSDVQSITNTATVAYTFADLATAKHYSVYLNRQLLRPTAEYTVSGSTVTFVAGLLATDDEIEVTGLKLA